MGILIAIIGGIVTLMCLVNGIAISPQSAVQQTVQELRYVEAALGAILFALGIAIHEIAVLRRVTAEKQSAAAVEKPADVPAAFHVGSRVKHTLWGVGEVTAVDGEVVTVKFDDNSNRSSNHLSRDLKPL